MTKFIQGPTIKRTSSLAQRIFQHKNISIGHVVLLLALVSFGVVYLAQVNALAAKSYKIKELENNVLRMQEQSQKLDVEIAYWRSMTSLSERLENIDMIPVGSVDYVTLTSSTVAKR